MSYPDLPFTIESHAAGPSRRHTRDAVVLFFVLSSSPGARSFSLTVSPFLPCHPTIEACFLSIPAALLCQTESFGPRLLIVFCSLPMTIFQFLFCRFLSANFFLLPSIFPRAPHASFAEPRKSFAVWRPLSIPRFPRTFYPAPPPQASPACHILRVTPPVVQTQPWRHTAPARFNPPTLFLHLLHPGTCGTRRLTLLVAPQPNSPQ